MTDLIDREHQGRSRAERVLTMLRALWGDALPAGPQPELTVLIDAIAIDDEHARFERLVSHGDGLTYDTLAALCSVLPTADGDPPGLTAQLPPVLLDRLQQLALLTVSTVGEPFPHRPVATTPAVRSASPHTGPGTAPVPALADAPTAPGAPDVRMGLWEVDPYTRTVAYDAVTAEIMDEEAVAGYKKFDGGFDKIIHPADRAHLQHAMRYSLRTETTYRVRYRVMSAQGVPTWVTSTGRVLRRPGDARPRLTGYLFADPSIRPSPQLVEVS